MIIVQCDSTTFFDKMCEPGFVRMSLHTGKCGNIVYHTNDPPEEAKRPYHAGLQRNLYKTGFVLHTSKRCFYDRQYNNLVCKGCHRLRKDECLDRQRSGREEHWNNILDDMAFNELQKQCKKFGIIK